MMNKTKQINLIVDKLDEAARRFSDRDIRAKKTGNRFGRLCDYLLAIKRKILA